MNKNGFTLIELLAIIVILGIIAIITTPVINNVINDSKKNSLVDTGYGLIDIARQYYADAITNASVRTLNVDFSNSTSVSTLKYKGTLPTSGTLKMDESGDIEMAIWSKSAGACAVKSKTDAKVTISKTITVQANCHL